VLLCFFFGVFLFLFFTRALMLPGGLNSPRRPGCLMSGKVEGAILEWVFWDRRSDGPATASTL